MEMETDIWAWVHRYMESAAESRDANRHALCRFVMRGMEATRTDPDQCLDDLSQAQKLAEEQNEPWWVLFCEHWMLQTMLFRKRDYARALPMAQAAIAEVAKPVYQNFPQRHCLQEDLISAYQGIDPIGFAPQIADALARMTEEVHPNSNCFHCLQGMQAEFLLDTGRLEEARDQALQASKKAALASDYHHVVGAYVILCRVAARQDDWDRLTHWSKAGDMFAGRDTDESAIAELRMWNAAAHRRSGDMTTAIRQYRKARAETKSQLTVPTSGYFDAWSCFHESGGNLRRALSVREREYVLLQNGGQNYLICRCHLNKCRLRASLGLDFAQDAAALRAKSRELKTPDKLLAELASLEVVEK